MPCSRIVVVLGHRSFATERTSVSERPSTRGLVDCYFSFRQVGAPATSHNCTVPPYLSIILPLFIASLIVSRSFPGHRPSPPPPAQDDHERIEKCSRLHSHLFYNTLAGDHFPLFPPWTTTINCSRNTVIQRSIVS
jgi:predicted membrane metal-binding protein